MKHHCHCHFKDQFQKFKAGKLGLLGGVLIIGHLLFHVAECLILPSILVAFHLHDTEAAEELSSEEAKETNLFHRPVNLHDLHVKFYDTLIHEYSINNKPLDDLRSHR